MRRSSFPWKIVCSVKSALTVAVSRFFVTFTFVYVFVFVLKKLFSCSWNKNVFFLDNKLMTARSYGNQNVVH